MNRSCSHLVWWWWWSDFIIVCGHWTTLIIECQPVHILWNASHARVLLWEFQQATRTSHRQLSRWCKSCWTVMRGEVLHHTSRHWLVVNLIQWLFVLLQPGLLNQCRNILGMWFHHIPFLSGQSDKAIDKVVSAREYQCESVLDRALLMFMCNFYFTRFV